MAVTSGVQPHCNSTCCRSRCILPTHRGVTSYMTMQTQTDFGVVIPVTIAGNF